MVGDGLVDKGFDGSVIARVAGDIGTVEVGADNGCAFAAEEVDRRFADARAGAGDDRDLALEAHQKPAPKVVPPSTISAWPVTKLAASEARKTAAPAIS